MDMLDTAYSPTRRIKNKLHIFVSVFDLLCNFHARAVQRIRWLCDVLRIPNRLQGRRPAVALKKGATRVVMAFSKDYIIL